jgi:N-acetylglutamate synthase-like GNAT family acetyltransferase
VSITYRSANSDDIAECIAIRGHTRDNAISVERLRELGITHSSWSKSVADGNLPGYVCLEEGQIVGYCFGDRTTGEIVVLAVLSDWEGKGIGKHLLSLVVQALAIVGHQRLFLGCSSKSQFRSHGFYRHLGWTSTGRIYANQDEELEYFPIQSKNG